MPLSPAIPLGGFDRDTVMVADNIGERLQSERSRVVFVRGPRIELDARHGLRRPEDRFQMSALVHSSAICARRSDPDSTRAARIRRGWPVTGDFQTNWDSARRWTRRQSLPSDARKVSPDTIDLTGDGVPVPPTRMSKSSSSASTSVQKDRVAPLPHVFLSNLQLNRLVRPFEGAEERRGWLADLKVDRAMLDLHDRIWIELPVQPDESYRRRRGPDRSWDWSNPCDGHRRTRDRKITPPWGAKCARHHIGGIRVRPA